MSHHERHWCCAHAGGPVEKAATGSRLRRAGSGAAEGLAPCCADGAPSRVRPASAPPCFPLAIWPSAELAHRSPRGEAGRSPRRDAPRRWRAPRSPPSARRRPPPPAPRGSLRSKRAPLARISAGTGTVSRRRTGPLRAFCAGFGRAGAGMMRISSGLRIGREALRPAAVGPEIMRRRDERAVFGQTRSPRKALRRRPRGVRAATLTAGYGAHPTDQGPRATWPSGTRPRSPLAPGRSYHGSILRSRPAPEAARHSRRSFVRGPKAMSRRRRVEARLLMSSGLALSVLDAIFPQSRDDGDVGAGAAKAVSARAPACRRLRRARIFSRPERPRQPGRRWSRPPEEVVLRRRRRRDVRRRMAAYRG